MITTDFYAICENAVVTLLRNTSAFDWTDGLKQVTKANDVYLDKGFKNFVITYPGAFPQVFQRTDGLGVQWEILLDVIVRWDKSEDQAWQDFRAHRSNVFNLFNLSYEGRDLNRTPSIEPPVILNAVDRPRYIPLNKDPNTDIVSHIGQVMSLTVTQTIEKEF